ncbi:DUF943 family protein [Erwinia sp. QL-Z3]|uniref:DUF943 family protein n=1 Tax=Erwinia sp. QL-Z3 TaxID=2547962 RepID=UPI001070C4C4|nr:DUF943 family protein [Erwinia sp. QL-Z3]QBR49712.1 DUF943 family protein [Erwinia sp. QL-Z3]
MKRLLIILAVLVFMASGVYFYLNSREVKVIDVHLTPYSAVIIVNHLPISTSTSIDWWLKNKSAIYSKYKILPSNAGWPESITFFAFGEGYQELGQEDRLCFADMKPPQNCIDKGILMQVSRTRDGDTQFRRHGNTYLMTQDGKITEVSKD